MPDKYIGEADKACIQIHCNLQTGCQELCKCRKQGKLFENTTRFLGRD